MLTPLQTSQPASERYQETREFGDSPSCPWLRLLLPAKMAPKHLSLQQTGKTGAQPDRRDWPQLRLVEWVYLAK